MTNPIFYASTGDGLMLPVVDVGHPAFEVRLTDSELDKITAGTIQIGGSNSGDLTVSATIDRSSAL